MPMYTYECKCGGSFEAFHRMADDSSWSVCPTCERAAHKVLTAPRINVENVRYQCPITNDPIMSKRAHAENLRRNGCHVMERGEPEAIRAANAAKDAEFERRVGESVERSIEQMPSAKVERLANELATTNDATIVRQGVTK